MKLLFVHEINYEKKPVYEFMEIPEALSLRGHDVTVVDYGEGEAGFLKSWREFSGSRYFKDARVRVIRPGRIRIGEFFGRFTSMFTNWLVLRKLFREENFDAVVLYSIPTNGWQTVLLAKKHCVPVFFRAIDTLHKLRPFKFPIVQIIKALEFFVYKRCDYVLNLTPSLGRYTKIKKQLPLYSAVNDNVFFPLPEKDLSPLLEKYGLKKTDNIITYIGYFYEFTGLEPFIERIAEINKEVPNTKLLLVGGGEADERFRKLSKLKDHAEKGSMKNIIFTGFVPYEDVAKYINISTVCLVPFKKCTATVDVSPIKLFQYLACKKPVLCRDLKGIREIVPDDKIVYAKTDSDMIARTIELLKNKKQQEEIAKRGYVFCMKNHSWKRFIDTVEEHLRASIKK